MPQCEPFVLTLSYMARMCALYILIAAHPAGELLRNPFPAADRSDAQAAAHILPRR